MTNTDLDYQRLNWVLQPAPPPIEKLREYAAALPPIYRDILVAFQASGPRAEGEPVHFGTIRNHLLNEGAQYTEVELGAALENLVKDGIVSERGLMTWFAPTRVGEALVEVLTGRSATPVKIPELPKRTW